MCDPLQIQFLVAVDGFVSIYNNHLPTVLEEWLSVRNPLRILVHHYSSWQIFLLRIGKGIKDVDMAIPASKFKSIHEVNIATHININIIKIIITQCVADYSEHYNVFRLQIFNS